MMYAPNFALSALAVVYFALFGNKHAFAFPTVNSAGDDDKVHTILDINALIDNKNIPDGVTREEKQLGITTFTINRELPHHAHITLKLDNHVIEVDDPTINLILHWKHLREEFVWFGEKSVPKVGHFAPVCSTKKSFFKLGSGNAGGFIEASFHHRVIYAEIGNSVDALPKLACGDFVDAATGYLPQGAKVSPWIQNVDVINLHNVEAGSDMVFVCGKYIHNFNIRNAPLLFVVDHDGSNFMVLAKYESNFLNIVKVCHVGEDAEHTSIISSLDPQYDKIFAEIVPIDIDITWTADKMPRGSEFTKLNDQISMISINRFSIRLPHIKVGADAFLVNDEEFNTIWIIKPSEEDLEKNVKFHVVFGFFNAPKCLNDIKFKTAFTVYEGDKIKKFSDHIFLHIPEHYIKPIVDHYSKELSPCQSTFDQVAAYLASPFPVAPILNSIPGKLGLGHHGNELKCPILAGIPEAANYKGFEQWEKKAEMCPVMKEVAAKYSGKDSDDSVKHNCPFAYNIMKASELPKYAKLIKDDSKIKAPGIKCPVLNKCPAAAKCPHFEQLVTKLKDEMDHDFLAEAAKCPKIGKCHISKCPLLANYFAAHLPKEHPAIALSSKHSAFGDKFGSMFHKLGDHFHIGHASNELKCPFAAHADTAQ